MRSVDRKSAPNSPRSASSIPTSVTLGKWWPLGEHLGADQDVDGAGMHPLENGLQRPLPAGAVAVHPGHAGAGMNRAQVLRHALGSQPDGPKVGAAAAGAIRRRRAHGAAVVAAHAPRLAVIDEMGIAVRAVRDPAALVADEDRCETAAIDEHEGLLASFEATTDGGVHGIAHPLPRVSVLEGRPLRRRASAPRPRAAEGAESA